MSHGALAVPRNRDAWWRFGLPGLVAMGLLSLGSLGVGWLPLRTSVIEWPVVESLRSTGPGLITSHILVFTGIAVLLQVWLLLGRALTGSESTTISTGDVVAIISMWSAPLLVAAPMFSRDAYSYYAQGRLMIEGYDPYTTGVATLPGWFQDGADPMWAESPTPYGPLFLLFSRGVASFSFEQPAVGALVFRILAVIGVLLLVIYLPRLAFAHGIDPNRAMWLAVANPLVIMHFVAGAHNDALMIGLIVMGLTLAVEGHPLSGSIAIALAASIKPIGLLALPFIGLIWAGRQAGWWDRIRAWLLSGITAAGAFGLTSVLAGVGLGWILALGTPGEVKTWLSPPTALGMILGGAARMIGISETSDPFVAGTRTVGAVIAVAIVAWLILGPWRRSPVRSAAWAFLAVVLLGPVVQPWYLLWVLPLFAVTGVNARSLRVIVLVTAGFCIHAMSESLATSDTIFELSDGLGIVVASITVAAILLISPRERNLILNQDVADGLQPVDAPAQARARQWTGKPPWQDAGS
jgi:alpha-1,6-mannosyltransferase